MTAICEPVKKKILELAIAFARKKQSPQTGYIHLFLEDVQNKRQDTIPLFENFLFVLALFRLRTSEQISEGKSLLKKLLPFEVEGNFPVYLHEFPECKDKNLSIHMLPIFFYLLRDFELALGEDILYAIRTFYKKIQKRGKILKDQGMLSRAAEQKLLASEGLFDPCAFSYHLPKEAADFLICLQMSKEVYSNEKTEMDKLSAHWNPIFHAWVKKNSLTSQYKSAPSVTLLDYFMAEYFSYFSCRFLEENIYQLHAALIQPFSSFPEDLFEDFAIDYKFSSEKKPFFELFWGDKEKLHSLFIEIKRGKLILEEASLELGYFSLLYLYDETIPAEDESLEWSMFCNRDSDNSIFINGQKAVVFALADCLTLSSKKVNIHMTFSLVEGSGVFCGHLSYQDRSTQLFKDGPFSSFD